MGGNVDDGLDVGLDAPIGATVEVGSGILVGDGVSMGVTSLTTTIGVALG